MIENKINSNNSNINFMKNFTLCSLLHKSHLSRQMKSAASLFAVMLLLLCGNVNAQNLKYYNSGSTSYQDYVVTGQAYQSIASTGTALYTTLGVPSTSTVKSFSLPFEFQYGTQHLAAGSTVYVNPSRGYVAMGVNYEYNYQYGNPSYDGTYYAKYCLSPCGGFGGTSPVAQATADFYYAMSIDNSGIFYTIQGTAPTRVAIIEFHNVMFYYDYSQVGDNSSYYTNFQVKLYEGTDKIEFCYGPRSNSISYTGNYYPFTFLMDNNYNDNIYLYGANDAKWENPMVDHYTGTNANATTYSHNLNNSGTLWTSGLTYVFNPAMPTGLTADFSDPLQTKLSWNASSFDETAWTIEYGTKDFTPGTGITLTTTNNVAYVIPDLSDGSYDFYVYAYDDKGVFGDANLSSATNKITIDMACRSDLLSETDAFDQYSIALPVSCWYNIADASDIVIAQTTINEIEEKVLKLDGTNGSITVVSADLDHLLDGNVIYFDIASENAGADIEVGYYDNGNFTAIKTVTTLRNDHFDQIAVDMTGAVGSILAFRNNNNNIVYIDNLYAKVKGSACDEQVPTGLFATAAASYDATVTWLGTAASYEIIYGVTGFNPDSAGTSVTAISALTYTITGLPEGTYDCYVRAECPGNGTSAWSKVSTFAIACTVNTLLDEDFNNRTPEVVDNCWKSLEDPNKAVIALKPNSEIDISFSYTGSVQSIILEAGTYLLQVWGAQGGTDCGYACIGSKGGYSKGILTLTETSTLYVAVGGKGGDEMTNAGGGWNGGGNAGTTGSSGGGGGATDIRINTNSLYARVIVAGGGGGAGNNYEDNPAFGGGIQAGPCNGYGYVANQNSGYQFGQGENRIGDGGGGGGGWYGGYQPSGDSYGGGGSGYVYNSSTAANYPEGCLLNTNYYLDSANTYAGNTSFIAPDGSNEVGQAGDGYAKISGTSNSLFLRLYNDITVATVYSPLLTFEQGKNLSNYAVEFIAQASTVGTILKVGTIRNGLFEYLGDVKLDSTTSFQNCRVHLNNAENTDVVIAFQAPKGELIYIDNVKLVAASVCQGNTPLHVTAVPSDNDVTEATVYWDNNTAIANGDGWAYVVTTAGNAPDWTSMVITNDSTNVIPGLSELTSYDVYVFAQCGGENSDTVMVSFDTKCEQSQAIPYIEDFESYTANVANDCWKDADYSAEAVIQLYAIGTAILPNQTDNYPYTGSYEIFEAQPGTYMIQVWGAQGGYRSGASYGGYGGYSVGTLTLTSPATMYIYVGGSGNTGGSSGGFNGGGSRGSYAGGGGATDVRLNSTSLYARYIVAGGGGSCGSASGAGGYGGGTNGGGGSGSYGTAGSGASQTGPGTSYNSGSFGTGGYGSNRSSGYGGAGGGGWYGGGGGYPDSSGDDDRGGGGGSGYVYTSGTAGNYPSGCLLNSSYYLTNAATYAGNTTFASTTGGTETGHQGNGYAKITYDKIITDYTKTICLNAASRIITVQSPVLNLNGYNLSDCKVTFKAVSSTIGQKIKVGVMENGSFVECGSVNTISDSSFCEHTIYLNSYNGNSAMIAFQTSKGNLVYIDSVVVENYNACELNNPTNFVANIVAETGDVELTWDANQNVDGWTLEYGEAPLIQGNGTVVSAIADSFYTFSSLNSATTYQAYLTANCGGSISLPASVLFNTPCSETQAIPFVEVFDGKYTANVVNDCWKDVDEPNNIVVISTFDDPKDFSYTGSMQSIELEEGSYLLEVWGAQGGKDGGIGSNGGYSKGTLNLTDTKTLYIAVGGKGGDDQPASQGAGWNGGGNAGSTCCSGGGGGASDIRIGENSLYARVVVAGGGGGAGNDPSLTNPGYAGGTQGAPCYGYNKVANQTSGYAFGQGEDKIGDGGGGGGGWYGGYQPDGDHYGGGGSGYVYTSSTAADYPEGCLLNSSYYLESAGTYAGNTEFVAPDGSNEVGHTGNGYARITLIKYIKRSCLNTISKTTLLKLDASSRTVTVQSPVLNLDGNNLRDCKVVFKAVSTTVGQVIKVGAMENGSFVECGSVITTSNSLEQYAVTLENYSGTSQVIAFQTPQGNHVYIDSVAVNVYNQCELNTPTNFTASVDAGTGEVTLSWDDNQNVNGWTLEFGAAPFTQGMGTIISNIANPSIFIDTLQSANTYKAYLTADCGNGDYSMPVSLVFTVPCLETIAIPFVEKFDGNYTADVVNDCWKDVDDANNVVVIYTGKDTNIVRDFSYTGTVQPVTLNSGTHNLQVWGAQGGGHTSYPGGKGGYSEGTLVLSSTQTLYVYVGGAGTYSTVSGSGVKSGIAGWNGGGSAASDGGGSLSMHQIASGGGGATDISIAGGDCSLDGYYRYVRSDNSYKGRIIVAGGGGGSNYGNANYVGGAGGGVSGQTCPAGTGEPGGGGGATAIGIGVRSDWCSARIVNGGLGYGSCSSGGVYQGGGGGWYGGGAGVAGGGGGSGYVYTAETAENYPAGCLLNSSYYLANANTYVGNTSFASKDGGTEVGHEGNGYAIITSTETILHNACLANYKNNVVLELDATSRAITVQSPVLNLNGNNLSDCKVVFKAISAIAGQVIKVGAMDNGSFIECGSVTTISNNSFEQYVVTLENYTGTSKVIAFQTPQGNIVYIDSVAVDTYNSCETHTPKNAIATIDMSTGEVTVSWAADAAVDNYVIEYDVKGFTEGTGSTITVSNTDSSYVFSNLVEGQYDAYIKAECGGGYSMSVKVLFAVPCVDNQGIPFSEDFEGYTANIANECWKDIDDNTAVVIYKVPTAVYPVVKTFDYTGTVQTLNVTEGQQYKLQVWGAQGGGSNTTTD